MQDRQIQVPLLTTSCNWDIRATLLAFPLLWVGGLDQFFWPVFSAWILVKWMLTNDECRRPRKIYVLFALLMVSMLISASAIAEGKRYVTFARNAGVLFGGVMLSYVVSRTHDSVRALFRTFTFILVFSAFISFAGLLAIVGVDFSFQAPLAGLIPSGVKSGYLADIFNKSFVAAEAGWFESGFIRPKGLMMYPNLLAGMILMTLPIKIFFYVYGSRRWRHVLAILFAVDAVVVIQTLSRSAWLGLGVAAFILLLFGRLPARMRLTGSVWAILILLALLLTGGGEVVVKRFVEKGHSNEGRALNYLMSINYVLQDGRHLLFGYGTQVDVPELGPPLGSHSTYLGLLFKYGVVGLSLYLVFCSWLLYRVFAIVRLSENRLWRHLGRILFSSLLVIIVQGIFIEKDVDATYAHVWWLLVGLSIAAIELHRAWRQNDGDMMVFPAKIIEDDNV